MLFRHVLKDKALVHTTLQNEVWKRERGCCSRSPLQEEENTHSVVMPAISIRKLSIRCWVGAAVMQVVSYKYIIKPDIKKQI